MRRTRRLVTTLAGALSIIATGCGSEDDTSADGDRASAEPVVVSGSGDIADVVEQYRQVLGTDNGGEPGGAASGRREINWDGVPVRGFGAVYTDVDTEHTAFEYFAADGTSRSVGGRLSWVYRHAVISSCPGFGRVDLQGCSVVPS